MVELGFLIDSFEVVDSCELCDSGPGAETSGAREAESEMRIKLRHASGSYWVERTSRPSGVVEYWDGIGYVGSERRQTRAGNPAGTTWWAAQNPSGKPYKATARVEGLPSRRQAVGWLLSNTDSR